MIPAPYASASSAVRRSRRSERRTAAGVVSGASPRGACRTCRAMHAWVDPVRHPSLTAYCRQLYAEPHSAHQRLAQGTHAAVDSQAGRGRRRPAAERHRTPVRVGGPSLKCSSRTCRCRSGVDHLDRIERDNRLLLAAHRAARRGGSLLAHGDRGPTVRRCLPADSPTGADPLRGRGVRDRGSRCICRGCSPSLNRHLPWLAWPFLVANVFTIATSVLNIVNHWWRAIPEPHPLPHGGEPLGGH